MIRWRSVVRGVLAMRRGHGPVGWLVRWGPQGFWFKLWTPAWHDGRGPYVSIGLGVVSIMRGY